MKPRHEASQTRLQETLTFNPQLASFQYQDAHDNITYRAVLQPGAEHIEHDALVAVSALPDNHGRSAARAALPIAAASVLRYTLPSRYCDSDKLVDFAWQQLRPESSTASSACRPSATGSTTTSSTASARALRTSPRRKSSQQRYGVCRDFAHVAIALCRAFNLPARYVTGHLPDIGCIDPGTPMDFHAYFEVYLGESG